RPSHGRATSGLLAIDPSLMQPPELSANPAAAALLAATATPAPAAGAVTIAAGAVARRPAGGMSRALRISLVGAVLLCSVGCDQMAKRLARAALAASPPVSLLNDFVRLELAQNRGAFLSL